MNAVRLKNIRAVLKKHGPLTIIHIAEITGYSASNVAAIVYAFRSNPGTKMMIRKSGKSCEFGTMPRIIFELSDEPDAEECTKSASKLSREESQERRHLRDLAQQIKPFRDPMLFLTAGVSP